MGASSLVGVGLPVYNGEDFLAAAIESVLAQTFRDFELIISDNASTDRTEEICRKYVAQDPRIKYHRAAVNQGIVWNYNRVFQLSSNKYFMWFAHDDVLAPTYLTRCLEVLEMEPSVILCFSRWRDIDGEGELLAKQRSPIMMDSRDPVDRFRQAIPTGHTCEPWCGVTRSEIVKKTPPYRGFADYDRVWLAELTLHGRFFQIPDALFFHREHSNRPIVVQPDPFERTFWLDPKNAGSIVFPSFRMFQEYLCATFRAPLSWRERAGCHRELAKWLRWNWRLMLKDLKVAARVIIRRCVPGRNTTIRKNQE
jgi:glycosyltransferase involved in cell wall biosynthesis